MCVTWFVGFSAAWLVSAATVAGQCDTPVFPGMTIELTGYPSHIATADLDGDGDLDAVVTCFGSGYPYPLRVLRNDGGGMMRIVDEFAVGIGAYSTSIADLDGDGDNDLAITHVTDENVAILMNHGDGTFAEPVYYDVPGAPNHAELGDVDGDGDIDMVVDAKEADSIAVFLNDGDGALQSAPGSQLPTGTTWLALGDLDGDGDLDVAAADWWYTGGDVRIALNDGAGVFSYSGGVDCDWDTRMLELGDIDGDGDLDVVVACDTYDDFGLVVLRNRGDATFAAPEKYLMDQGVNSVAITDVDNDTDLDIVAASGGRRAAKLLRNDGTGLFAEDQLISSTPNGTYAVACADLSTDGWVDLLTATDGETPAFATVFLNTGEGRFHTQLPYDLPVKVDSVQLGDVDGDGDQDVMVWLESDIYLLTSLGGGRLSDPISMSFDNDRDGPHLLDTDVDGDADVITVNGQGDVLFYESLGAGEFADAAILPACWNVSWLEFSDLDGDGDPDLVANWTTWPYFEVDENIGDGVFVERTIVPLGIRANHLAMGDLDGDGDGDIIYTKTHSDGAIRVFINEGEMAFTDPVIYPAAYPPLDIALGDVDADGDLDLLARTGNSASQILRYLNEGDGSFQPHTELLTRFSFTDILLPDLNLDGRADLLLPRGESYGLEGNSVPVFYTIGDGILEGPTQYLTGSGPSSVAVGDVTGDGLDDLVTVNTDEWSDGPNLSVLPNLCTAYCPGDVDGDGTTGQPDLGLLLASYELDAGDPLFDARADLNGDGEVGQPDLGILLADYECGL